jgi:flagellin
MSSVNLTNSVRQSLFSLLNVNSNLDTVQGQLSTGLRVNSSKDDAVAFFAAAALNDRADGLDTLIRGVKSGLSILDAADKGFNAITAQVKQLQSVVQQAQASPVGYDIKAQATISGSAASGTTTAATTDDLTNGGTSGLKGVAVTFRNDQNQTITISVGSTPAAFAPTNATGTSGTATVKTLSQLNQALTDAHINLSATLDTNNTLTFKSTDDGASQTLSAGTSQPVNGINDLDIVASAGVATGSVTTATPVANVDSQNRRDAFAQQYANILNTITQTAATASVGGVNLLTGNSTTINFSNDDNKSKLNVAGIDASATGLGLTALKTGAGPGAATGDLADTHHIDAVNVVLTKVLANLHTSQANFGSQSAIIQTRSDFLTNLSGTLRGAATDQVGADKNLLAVQDQALLASQQFAQVGVQKSVATDQAALQLLR